MASNNAAYKVDGSAFESIDVVLSGRQIRQSAGLAPASNYVLIKIGQGTSQSIGLDEAVDLNQDEPPCFLSFESDRVFSLTINERGFEWGASEISASDIRAYGGIPDDHQLILDSEGDRPIEDDDVVRLKAKGAERIISKPMEKICIVINTVEEYVEPGRFSFEELAKLAFPNTEVTPNTEYTVSYRKGPGNKPEGSLIAGESVKLKKGMIFDVSETDKS
ncbi:multiubiquitin domain-containing protein [uncultured Tateyamaria sp.]|uniref:multiubiquitin domain-containing protein n=1 Tax=uncultured Tateyamaria sp. TaxID=455651 RepID=UPI0026036653|nr:multiubiquitin domain-containing protein [uncultured Tateyamaria sp.]